jgi:ADP-ribosylglycohydrolase
MLGAIAGDIMGSYYEWNKTKLTNFELFPPKSKFTDDTVLTIAVADAIIHQKEYAPLIKSYGRKYPHARYGGMFRKWLDSDSLEPYNSFGNGSAMRVSPVGFAFDTLEKVLEEAQKTADVTHNHPEGVKGAQATASAVFLARTGSSKEEIRSYVEQTFGYNLQRTIEQIRPTYQFDVTCQGSVPEAIIAFLDADDYESTVRLAISLGGDADTQAAIAGGIAHAFYKKIPADIIDTVRLKLDMELWQIVEDFQEKYKVLY